MNQFTLFKRNGIFYCQDSTTGKQTSLRTRNVHDAHEQLIRARNEARRQPAMNLQLARSYLAASDPAMLTRTWQQVVEHIIVNKKGPTQTRWTSALKAETAAGLAALLPALLDRAFNGQLA